MLLQKQGCVYVLRGERDEFGKVFIQTYFRDIFEGWPLPNKQREESDRPKRDVCKLPLPFMPLGICFYSVKVCILSKSRFRHLKFEQAWVVMDSKSLVQGNHKCDIHRRKRKCLYCPKDTRWCDGDDDAGGGGDIGGGDGNGNGDG